MEKFPEIEKLAQIIPPNLQKKYDLAKFKLVLIVIVWITIAVYSFIATFLGYKLSNLGNVSFILALSSQIFTVIYAIPDMGDVRKHVFNKFTLPFWLIICLTAHVISFGGSAFYHYMKTSQVSGRPDITTPYQAKVLRETQEKILFNTKDYKIFLNSLVAYYELKKESSLEGTGASSIKGRGDRVKLLENVVSEIKEELSLANAKFPDDQFDKIVNPQVELSTFLTLASNISANATHPDSNIVNTADALSHYKDMKKDRPPLNFNGNEKVISQKEGRALIRQYISQYPFVKIDIPYEDLGAASGKFKSVNAIIKEASLFDEKGAFKPNNAFGLFAATIIEVATLIFNLFFIVQGKNLKTVVRRMNRRVVLNNAVDLSRSTIAHFTLITRKANDVDLSYPIMMISMAREQIFRKLEWEHKLYCSDTSANPKRNERKPNILRRFWVKWGWL